MHKEGKLEENLCLSSWRNIASRNLLSKQSLARGEFLRRGNVQVVEHRIYMSHTTLKKTFSIVVALQIDYIQTISLSNTQNKFIKKLHSLSNIGASKQKNIRNINSLDKKINTDKRRL